MPPFTPDLPSPKGAGDAIRSKDWNEHIDETKRLGTAKVDRSGDEMSGPLSIEGALRWGKGANKSVLTTDDGGSIQLGGDGSANAVGSPYINFHFKGTPQAFNARIINDEDGQLSIDAARVRISGALTIEAALKGTSIELAGGDWLTEDNVFLKNDAKGKLSILAKDVVIQGALELRGGDWATDGDAYLRNDAEGHLLLNAGRVSISGDERVVIRADMTQPLSAIDVCVIENGSLGVRAPPAVDAALYVNGDQRTWGLDVLGNCRSSGRFVDDRIREYVAVSNDVSIVSNQYVGMPGMSRAFAPVVGAKFQILVQINEVTAIAPVNCAALFSLSVDGAQQDEARHEFHSTGWEMRSVTLSTLIWLDPGQHTVNVSWYAGSNVTLACQRRQLQIIEL